MKKILIIAILIGVLIVGVVFISKAGESKDGEDEGLDTIKNLFSTISSSTADAKENDLYAKAARKYGVTIDRIKSLMTGGMAGIHSIDPDGTIYTTIPGHGRFPVSSLA